MKLPRKEIIPLLKQSFQKWKSDNAMRLAASLAYYTAFSLAPMLLAAIAIGGLLFGEAAARGQIYQELKGTLGPSVAAAIEQLVQSASKPARGIPGALLAFVLVLFGASGVFGELKDALNIVWKQQPPAHTSLRTWIKGRFLSVGMVMGICFLLLVSLVMNTALGVVTNYGTRFLSAVPLIMQVTGILVSFGFVVLLFAFLYKYLPDTPVSWSDVWTGSFVTAIFFTLGKSGLEIYISRAAVGSGYGAAGALALVLVWVYYSAQVFLMGAEFTAVYAEKHGSKRASTPPITEDSPAPGIIPAPPSREVATPVSPPLPAASPAVPPGLSHLTRMLGIAKSVKLKPYQQWTRFLGAGLMLAAIRTLDRWKEKRSARL